MKFPKTPDGCCDVCFVDGITVRPAVETVQHTNPATGDIEPLPLCAECLETYRESFPKLH